MRSSILAVDRTSITLTLLGIALLLVLLFMA
jgi:hypothetical protein